jgi:prephenate dehydrogenase
VAVAAAAAATAAAEEEQKDDARKFRSSAFRFDFLLFLLSL